MTNYNRLINDIKDKCDKSWLTTSQQAVYNKVTKGLTNHRVINIYGKEGTGKTFIGWIIDREGLGRYFHDPDAIDGKDLGEVVVDNFPHDRLYHRQFRSQIGNWGITRAIVLSLYSIQDDIPKLQLEFTEEDRNEFKSILYKKLRVQISQEDSHDNMHDIIRKNIWRLNHD